MKAEITPLEPESVNTDGGKLILRGTEMLP